LIMDEKRVVRAFVGEYASGKSENAVAQALALNRAGRTVSLIDLDLVEPCYTLRPIKDELSGLGINVVAWRTEETFGLGEAGSIIPPAARWALRQPGDIIIDVGYGVYGSRSLNLIEDIDKCEELQVVLVLNTCRPLTGSEPLIDEYIKEIGRVDAIVANSHLMNETTPELVVSAYALTEKVAKKHGLPVLYAAVSPDFNRKYPDFCLKDAAGAPVEIKILDMYMPHTFW
jgi:hypothetical protein